MPERSCTLCPPAGIDPHEFAKALRDAAMSIASEHGLGMHAVAASLMWQGDRFVSGWQVTFRDDGARLPAADDALADMVAEQAELAWQIQFGGAIDDESDDVAGRFAVSDVTHDSELAALFAKMARSR